jgi:radical SAM protein with 4Fe4S-binding SPASM domain
MVSRKRIGLYWRLWQTFSSQPGYYFCLLGRRQAKRIRAALKNGAMPGHYYPTKLNLRLLYQCNLRCKMCGQWGQTGSYYGFDAGRRGEKLEIAVIDRVLEELTPNGLRLVDMEGGETLLYPNFPELLQTIRRKGVYVKFATNGTLLGNFAETIVKTGVSSITVSIDGDRETHNSIRGGKWIYDRVIEGLLAVAEARRIFRKRTPLVQAALTVTRHNGAGAIERLCRDLRGKGLIDVLEIKLTPIYVPSQASAAYRALLRTYFGVTDGIRTPEGFEDDYRDFVKEGAKLVETMGRLRGSDLDFMLEPLPHMPLVDIPRLYSDYGWDLGRSPCVAPFDEPTIDADGNVYACNLFTDPSISLGSVHEQSFLDIWNGERFMTFRRMLLERKGLLPICTRCCQLTEY